ncbi:MAG: hypothetical protein ACP5PZ_11670 [Bacteroidales bacterium]
MSIKKAIKQLAMAGEEVYLLQGTVTAVDTQSRTCTVRPANGADIPSCLLQGAYGSTRGWLLVPRIGSKVVVGFLSPNEAAVLLTSEIERIQLTAAGESLQTLLIDLCAAIEQLTVSTPAGPSGTPLPPTIEAVTQLKQRIQNFIMK